MFKRFSHESLGGERSPQGGVPHSGYVRLTLGALLVGLLAPSLGCGNTLYAISSGSASSKLEEARELNAEQYAPYEFHLAQEHLTKAKSEAAEADYSDALNLAEAAEGYADRAIRLSREARRGAGR